MAGPRRYRDLVAPVIPDVINQDTGAAQVAQELSDTFASFGRLANEGVGIIRAEQGAREGEAAGAAGTPAPRTGFRAGTAYGRAYNSAAEAAYSAKMQTDIQAHITKLEQDNEGDLMGFETSVKDVSEKLLAEVPPEYRTRVEQALAGRVAAGAARVRDQQIAFEQEAHQAAVMEAMPARVGLAVAAAMHLPREEGDAAIEAAVAENRAQLDALVRENPRLATWAVAAQAEFIKDLDTGLLATRTNEAVENLMNVARVDVARGDDELGALMADESIPLAERLEIRKAYDQQRTALGEDRARQFVEQSTELAKRLAADESGAGVENASWGLYRKGAISRQEHEGNLRKSVENGLKRVEDDSDVEAVQALLATGRGIYPKNSKQVKALNKLVDREVAASGMQKGDDRWTAAMVDVAKTTNILPDQALEYAATNLLSGDPLQAAKGAAFFARVQDAKPEAWPYNDDPELAVFADQLNRNVSAGIDPARAYELAHRNAYELKKEERELLEERMGKKKDVRAENASALMDALNDDPNFDQTVWAGSPEVRDTMQAEFNDLVTQYYTANGGKIDDARSLAGKAIRSRYGVTSMNGSREVVKFAPERMYPYLTGEFIRQDLHDKLAAAGYKDVVAQPVEETPVVDPLSPASLAEAKRRAEAPPAKPTLPETVRLRPAPWGMTDRTKGLQWAIEVKDEDGHPDILLGPDNQPLIYELPIGEDYDKLRAEALAKKKTEFDRVRELTLQNDPVRTRMQLEQLDDVRR